MLYLLDQIDYWRDQLALAVERHDKRRAITCGEMLWALDCRKRETYRFAA